MEILLSPELETALKQLAVQTGVSPSQLVSEILKGKLAPAAGTPMPLDEWERLVVGIAIDCGVSLSNETLSSERLYD